MKILLLALPLLLAGCAATTEAVKSDLEVFAQNVNRAIAREPEPRPEPKPAQRPVAAVKVAAAPAAEPAAPQAKAVAVRSVSKAKPKPAWLCQPVLQEANWICDSGKLVARPSAKTRVLTREKAKAVRIGQYQIEYQADLPMLYRTVTR